MLTRREFLTACRNLSIGLIGTPMLTTSLLKGFSQLAESSRPLVMFVQGQSCTGCTVSLTYGNEFEFLEFILKVIRLQVHPTLSFSQGERYLNLIDEMVEEGGYTLVMEGSIPAGMKEACYMGHSSMYEYLKPVARNAAAIVAAGTCASNGGIPASNQNVTGAISMPEYLKREGISVPCISLPGCPVHPDRLMGTVAAIVATGRLPELVEGRPRQYYGELIHNQCSRYQHFQQDQYVEKFADDQKSCLLKKGCRGPITYSDCPSRRWNGKVNVCIESNTPCIGCVHPDFPFHDDMYLAAESVPNIPWNRMREALTED